MATHVCSRHELKVRFLSPAPIFVFIFMICLCGSAGAVDLDVGTTYTFNQFNAWQCFTNLSTSTLDHSYFTRVPAGDAGVGVGARASVIIAASNESSGSLPLSGGNNPSINNSCFDLPDYFSNIHLSFEVPYNTNVVSDLNYYPTVSVWWRTNTSSVSNRSAFSLSQANGVYNVIYTNTANLTVYSVSCVNSGSFVHCDVYCSLAYNTQLSGFSIYTSRPGGFESGDTWGIPLNSYSFEVANQRFNVPAQSGTGGIVDLSGITSQINDLSAQMTASFNQVNANIDAAESSISQSIDNQTTALQGTIQHEVSGLHDHFDSWDNQISDSFDSDDAQIVVDTNAAVSGVHQFEQDQVDDTQVALDDVGLDGYSIPFEISGTFSEVGTIFTLLFNSFGFVTPLIIFSCTFGIAFVLIGRKSRGSE